MHLHRHPVNREHNARSLALLEGLHRDAHGQSCHCLDGLEADGDLPVA